MPKNKQQLRRVQGIDYCLNKQRRTKKNRLALRFGVTEKTISRTIRIMKNEYDAPILYDNDGYFYSEKFSIPLNLKLSSTEINQLKIAVKTLNQFQHLDIFKDLEGLVQKIENAVHYNLSDLQKNFIHFESVPFYEGTELIDIFIEAIESYKSIRFDYQSFKTTTPYHHLFHPYALKEHTNRWYVIGYLPEEDSVTSFALDRIIQNKNLNITNSAFKILPSFSIDQYFQYTVGMTVHSDKNIEEIIMSFSPLQAKYFKSKPFHPYHIQKENKDQLIVKMHLIPNYELVRKLAGFGNGVKILSPQSLIEEVTTYLKDALNQYS